MTNNIAIIASSITIISAIVSPVIASIVNNRHQRKVKAMELFFTEQAAVYKELVEKVMLFTYNSGIDGEDYANYLCCFEKAYLVADPETLKSLDNLSKALSYLRFTKSNKLPKGAPPCSIEDLHKATHELTIALNKELQFYKNYK